MPSAPSRSASAVEPTRSQKSTVTGLRSPSSALRDVRIRSARCRGVYAAGLRASGPAGGAGAGAAGPAAPTARPHSEQNFAVSGSSAPQAAQARGSRWPHSRQNFAREGLSCWQRGHRIEVRPGMLGGGRRYPVVTSWQNWPTRYGSWNVPARPRRTSSAAACDSARR